jgi:hypothetical protein
MVLWVTIPGDADRLIKTEISGNGAKNKLQL